MSIINKFNESVQPKPPEINTDLPAVQDSLPLTQASLPAPEEGGLVPPPMPEIEVPDMPQNVDLPGMQINMPGPVPGTPDADFEAPPFSQINYEVPSTINWNPAPIPRAPRPKNIVDSFLQNDFQDAVSTVKEPGFNPLALQFGDSGTGLLGALVYGATLPFNMLLGTSADLGRIGSAVEAGRRSLFDPNSKPGVGAVQRFTDAFLEQGRLTADGTNKTFFQQALTGRQFSFADPGYNEQNRLNPYGRTLEAIFGIDNPKNVSTLKETKTSSAIRRVPYIDALSGVIGVPVETALKVLSGDNKIKIPKLSTWIADRAKQIELDGRQFWKSTVGLGLDVIVEGAVFDLPSKAAKLGARSVDNAVPSTLTSPPPGQRAFGAAGVPDVPQIAPPRTSRATIIPSVPDVPTPVSTTNFLSPPGNLAVVPYVPNRSVQTVPLGTVPELSTFELEDTQKLITAPDEVLLLPPGADVYDVSVSWKNLDDGDLVDLANNISIDSSVETRFIGVDPNESLLNGTFENLSSNLDTLPEAKYIWSQADEASKVSFLRNVASSDSSLAKFNLTRKAQTNQILKGQRALSQYERVAASEAKVEMDFPAYTIPSVEELPPSTSFNPDYYDPGQDVFVEKVNDRLKPYSPRGEIQQLQTNLPPAERSNSAEAVRTTLGLENSVQELIALGEVINEYTAIVDDLMNLPVSEMSQAPRVTEKIRKGFVAHRRMNSELEPGDVIRTKEEALEYAFAPVSDPRPDVEYGDPSLYEVDLLDDLGTDDSNVIVDPSKVSRLSQRALRRNETPPVVSVAEYVGNRADQTAMDVKAEVAYNMAEFLEDANVKFMELVQQIDTFSSALEAEKISNRQAATFESTFLPPKEVVSFEEVQTYLSPKQDSDSLTIQETLVELAVDEPDLTHSYIQRMIESGGDPEKLEAIYNEVVDTIKSIYTEKGAWLPPDLLPPFDEICL